MTAHEYTEQSEKGDGGEVDSAVTEIVYANTDEGCDPATEENSFGRTADRAGCGAAEKAGGEEPVGTARIETPGFIPAPELIGTVDIGDILLTETASRGDRAGDRGETSPLYAPSRISSTHSASAAPPSSMALTCSASVLSESRFFAARARTAPYEISAARCLLILH